MKKKKSDFKSMASIESQLLNIYYYYYYYYLVMSNVFKSLVSGSDSTFLEK